MLAIQVNAIDDRGIDNSPAQFHGMNLAVSVDVISDFQIDLSHAIRLQMDKVPRVEDHAVGLAVSSIVQSFHFTGNRSFVRGRVLVRLLVGGHGNKAIDRVRGLALGRSGFRFDLE